MKKLFAPAVLVACCFTLSLTEIPEKLKAHKDYVYIPAGTQQSGERISSFQPFLMLNHEVTNGEYKKFLAYLRTENRMSDLELATPDTSAWNFREGGYMDPMVVYYFSHPAYESYPVVNVSANAAAMYCDYLTTQLREEYGEKITVKLPTAAQWTYAASGGSERASYSWSGMSLRDEKGNYRANYFTMGDESITRKEDGSFEISEGSGGSWYEDGSVIAAPSISYSANEFGLFNMCGNVSEIIDGGKTVYGGDWYSPGFDIRIESSKAFEKPVPYSGFRPVIVFE